MACENEQSELNAVIASVTKNFEAEMGLIASKAKSRSAKLESEFESNQDISEGVGATAGTMIGAVLGGAPGAAVGAALGQQVGKLLIVEIREKVLTMSTDLPAITNTKRDVVVSVPEVAIKNDDIVFSKPEIVMVRHRGPNIPDGLECRGLKCRVRYKETWYKRPETRMVEHRIVIGVPTLSMRKKTISMSIPEVSMRRREFSFTVPQITLRFVQDAGKRLAAAAMDVANEASIASENAENNFRARLKSETSSPLMALFECQKRQLKAHMDTAAMEVDAELTKLNDALTAMKARGVPEVDNEYVKARESLERAIQSRMEIVKPWQEALDALDREMATALEQFSNA